MALTKRSVKGSALTFAEMDANWDEVSAAGGLTFIVSTDISNAATFDFTAVDASAYDNYVIYLMNVIPATDNSYLEMRTSTDGGSSYDSSSGNYGWAISGMDGAGGQDDQLANDVQIRLNGDKTDANRRFGSAAGEDGVSGVITVHGPHLAKETFITWNIAHTNANGDGAPNHFTGAGKRKSSADVDAFRIMFNTGNIESGTISVFGVKNA